jgi:hypothetical protein
MRTIKSIRLPRKLKKDVIKVCGRENYYKMMFMSAYATLRQASL